MTGAIPARWSTAGTTPSPASRPIWPGTCGMPDLRGMVLAAGHGTRLAPVTDYVAKPLLPYLGRTLLDRACDALLAGGCGRVVVNAHHRAHQVAGHVDARDDRERFRVSLEPEILGTAGGLARARDAGLLSLDRPTVIANGKLVTDIDLGRALDAHRASGASVTLVLRPNPHREAFTTVRVEAGRVVGFGPSRVPEGPAPLAFTGVHVLEPEVLRRAEPRFSDTVRDLYPPEIAAGRVLAHV
ncbi:NTP transferase domain-containing protein, partial [bacterium]|nr:NTP transferase domain-containing protein [bacterium]